MNEQKRPIKFGIQAQVIIDPRDAHIISEWDIEELRHLVFDIGECSLEFSLGGIRVALKFCEPTPFELKAAEIGEDVDSQMFVGPLPALPDVQVVVRWRHGIASLTEILVIRRFLPPLQRRRLSGIIEQARSSPYWILFVGHPADAERMFQKADRERLRVSVEPFVPPEETSPEQFTTYWGCETPSTWWPR